MATYYVRPDGNNANAGTGPAANQAWATVAYALANAALPDATNTIYIAPGTYRGSVTLSITPSVSNTLVVAGDPTAAQFTGVTAGRVRITTYTTDNTGTPTSSQTLTCDNKTYFTLRNLHIEGYQTTNGVGIAHFLNSKNYTVEKCLFTHYRRGSGTSCIFLTTTTTTAINATFDKCIIVNGYAGLNIVSPSTGSTFDLGVTVKDTIITLANNAVIITNPSEGAGVGNGVTFYNCILQGGATLYLRSTNTTNKTFFYNNAIVAFAGIGLDATSNTVTEDYNRFSCSTDRSGPAAGSNSQSGVFASDFDYSRITGLYALDFWASYNGSIAQNTGTLSGAPTVDIFGDAWSNANPDVGAATFKIASSVGAYNPTERNASTITIAPDSTSQSIELYLGATGLTASTSGLSAYYNRTRSADVQIPLVARNITQNWTSGGFAEVNANTMPGVYRLDIPNEALAAGADDVTVVVRGASGTNGAVMSIKLSSGGLTSAQTASAVLDAVGSSYTNAGSIGHAIQNNNVTAIVGSTAAASELSGALLHNGTDYIDSNLLGGASTRVFVGRFQLTQTGTTQGDIIEAFTTDTPAFELQLFDGDNNIVPVTGATLGLRILDVTSTVVETGTPTIEYGTGGIVRWTAPGTYLSIGCPAGMYRMFVDRTVSGTTTTFGPLQIKVQVQ